MRKVVVRSWVGTDPKLETQKDVDAAFARLVADADRAGLIVGAPPKDGGLQGWTAGYDSPMTDPGERRHEVWLPLMARKSEVAPAPGGGREEGCRARRVRFRDAVEGEKIFCFCFSSVKDAPPHTFLITVSLSFDSRPFILEETGATAARDRFVSGRGRFIE